MDFVLNRFSDPQSYAYSWLSLYHFAAADLERIKRYEVPFVKGPCPQNIKLTEETYN